MAIPNEYIVVFEEKKSKQRVSFRMWAYNVQDAAMQGSVLLGNKYNGDYSLAEIGPPMDAVANTPSGIAANKIVTDLLDRIVSKSEKEDPK